MTQTGTVPTHAAPAREVPRRRLGFALTAIAATLMMAGASAPSPFYPTLQARLGLDAAGITLAFAVYAVVLLVALLTAGSVSDHIGRRPVVTAGFALLAVSVLMLWAAQSPATLFAARGLQGLASGLLLSTLSAAIIDFAPPSRPRTAAVVNSVTPMLGLALGAVVAGILLDASADPETLVFLPLAAAYLVVAVAIWFVPETSAREEGWLRALVPRIAVPAPARRAFALSLPVIVAGWATGGLFLSLGATIVRAELHAEGHAGQGLVIGLLPAAGAAAVLVLRNRSPRVVTVYGASALAVGTALSLVALALASFPAYVVAVIVVGSGFGPSFMGTIGTLIPAVAVHQRAELFAAIYTASYLGFSIPAVAAGVFVGAVGLDATVAGYGILVALTAAAAAILRMRLGAPRASA
jgi:predicted MFS family arabinose efflux permease